MTDDMNARARVKRLEAALRYITSESGCEHFTTGLGSCYRSGKCEDAEDWADKVCSPCKAHAALATPPPEGEPEQTEGMVEPPHDVLRSALRRSAKKVYPPQQAHGDALAALDRVREFVSDCEVGDTEPGTGKNEENREVKARLNDLDYIIRQALTASGVPYVPENIRRLVDTWRTHAEKEIVAPTTGRWMTRKCADDLAGAIASAPAVCEWTCQGPDAYGHEQFRGQCGANWWCVEGYGPELIRDGHPYCHGCGRRIQIAAAPQRGK